MNEHDPSESGPMRPFAFFPPALLLALALLWWGLLAGRAWAAPEAPPERMTATVVEFSVRGELNEQAGAIIADLMMSAIANSGRFTLKDRLPLSAAAKIAKAQELGSTGLLDPKTAAELGRLYGVDAVVTGGVSKLGDLITVTARLIDTKTASLLGSGQIQDKSIDAIQIKINDLAAMVTAPPAPPQTHALTVRTDPADAGVRLLNHPAPYQAGMRLPPGDYEIEVAKPGHVTRKQPVRIGDADVALNVVLDKARYGLTVRAEPPDAQIRLLGAPTPYQPGVALPPGDYEIEVAREGYASHKFPVRIVDSEVSVPVALEKVAAPPPPPVRQYRLTVQVDPPQATVKLLNAKTVYRPGMALPPGNYTVEISQSGYEPAQVAVPIIDSDVTVPVKLARKPEPAPIMQYRLTVRADPPDARVRLLGMKTAYKSGASLPPGSYTVEVSRNGYETRQVPVRIADSDVTVPVALVKLPEPERPPQYRLTVRADPPDARVRLLGTRTAYRAGASLPPGSYTVEVSRDGYETRQVPVRIADSDVTVPVALVKRPEPERPPQYRLTVRADPPDARVRLRGTPTVYRPGIPLPPGGYTVEVSRPGYETRQLSVTIADADVTVPVTLAKQPEPAQPEQYRLTVRPNPTSAWIRLVNSPYSYRPGVLLPPGGYTVEVGGRGYEPKRVTVQIADRDLTVPVELARTAPVTPEPARETSRPGEWRIGRVVVDGSLSGVDRSEVSRVLGGYSGRTVTRESLLDAAMQVYRSTGITLSFVVRSGGSELYARVARQTRRSYESTISVISRSQLELSGFGVSVE